MQQTIEYGKGSIIFFNTFQNAELSRRLLSALLVSLSSLMRDMVTSGTGLTILSGPAPGFAGPAEEGPQL